MSTLLKKTAARSAVEEHICHFLVLLLLIHTTVELMLYFSSMWRILIRVLSPPGIWKDISVNASHLIKCFCSFGCLVSGVCWLCYSPFLDSISLPPPFLRFDDEKNRKSRKRYMHFHPGSVSAFFFVFFCFVLHFTKLTRKWSIGFQKCTNTPHCVPRVISRMITFWPKWTTFLFPLFQNDFGSSKQAEELVDWFPKIGGLVIV